MISILSKISQYDSLINGCFAIYFQDKATAAEVEGEEKVEGEGEEKAEAETEGAEKAEGETEGGSKSEAKLKEAKAKVKEALDNVHMPKIPKIHKPAFLKKKKEGEEDDKQRTKFMKQIILNFFTRNRERRMH